MQTLTISNKGIPMCNASSLLLPFVLLALPAAAQAFTWRLESPANTPSARMDATMAHDDALGRTVLFGGYNAVSSLPLGDCWEWTGSDWNARFSLHYPPPRQSAAMVYDSARQRLVLFGGRGLNGETNDTWENDGIDWVQRTGVGVAPSPRQQHAMAYDSVRQRTVLFGGVSSQGVPSNQTFEWDGTSWLLRSSAVVPPARGQHGMAYDPQRQRTVMFGGQGTSNILSDTWEWNGTVWQQRFPPSVPMGGLISFGFAYDTSRQRTVLFAGRSSGQPTNGTFEWDGNAWTQQFPVTSPSDRFGVAMAFDATRQRMVVFGGNGPAGFPITAQMTWTRGQFGTVATAASYGSGCGAPALALLPAARPVLGQSGGATLDGAPTVVAAVAMGWSRTQYGPFSLPVTLGSIGMPGCALLQSSEVFGLSTAAAGPGSLDFALPLPNALSLAGARVYLQGYAFAPGANALQLVVSNGVEWFLGDV